MFSSGLSQAFAFDLLRLEIASIIHSFYSNSVDLDRKNWNLVWSFGV